MRSLKIRMMMNEPCSDALKPALSKASLRIDELPPIDQVKMFKILESDDFIEAKTFREQVLIVVDLLYEDRKPNYSRLAKMFGCKPESIKWQCNKKSPKPCGRPSLLPPDARNFIVEAVKEGFNKRNPISVDYLQEALSCKYNITIHSDTLRHYCRRIKEIKLIDAIPMESERIQVSEEDIAQKYKELEEHLKVIPGEFIFNVDETGCSDWVDSHEMKVFVPSDYESSSIKYPRNRASKRASLVGCIAADGSTLKPMIIIPRKTIEEELELYGYTRRNVCFAYQEHSFMTSKLFLKWANEIFFPYVDAKRAEMGYDGNALLILDGLPAHNDPIFRQQCEEKRIKILFLVPHSSDQTQPLDLVTFSLFKRYYARSTFNQMISAQSNQMIKMLGAWYQATPPHLNIKAFMAAGLRPSIQYGYRYYSVDLSLASKIRDWRSIDDTILDEEEARKRVNIANNQA